MPSQVASASTFSWVTGQILKHHDTLRRLPSRVYSVPTAVKLRFIARSPIGRSACYHPEWDIHILAATMETYYDYRLESRTGQLMGGPRRAGEVTTTFITRTRSKQRDERRTFVTRRGWKQALRCLHPIMRAQLQIRLIALLHVAGAKENVRK